MNLLRFGNFNFKWPDVNSSRIEELFPDFPISPKNQR